ncbi:hypothetical protein Tco_1165015 [Tanacetum coccineum]
MSLQEMEDLKQHYLDEMLSLSNDLGIKDYRNKKIDIRFRRECENMIDELKGKFNGMSIEINKKKELQQLEHAAKLSTYTTEPSRRFNYFYDDDDEESSIHLRDIISKLPPSIAITSGEFIKFSVEDLFPIPSESEDTSGSGEYDDESLSEEDVLKDNVKIYSNHLFEFNDEYISSDVNSLFDEVLGDIECKDSYDSNLDESTFLVTPLSDSNEDEFFAPGDDVKLLLHRDSSTPMISVDSILEGFTDEPPLEENDDLFDLESNEDDWKKILYDAPIDDLIFDPGGDIDEIDTFLNVDISTDIEDGYHDSEGYILYLKSFLSNDTILNPHPKVFLDHDQKSLSDINDLKIMVKVFDPGIHETIFSPTYVSLPFEDRHYLSFTYVIRIFLPYFTYPVESPFLFSSGSEDIIFDPGISAFHFSSLKPVAYKYPGRIRKTPFPSRIEWTFPVFQPENLTETLLQRFLPKNETFHALGECFAVLVFISSDVNPLFDEVLEDIECKDSYDSNLDESNFLVTPLFDSNEDECLAPSDDIELLLHHDPSISVVSILEGFTDEPPLEENDDLFDLESKENDWKKILYDSPIDDLITEDKVFDPGIHEIIFSPTYVNLSFVDHHYLSFTYVIRTFLRYFTYPVNSPFPLSSGSEDIIFDPDISAFHFSSLKPVAYECPMEVCSSTCFIPNITMIWGEIAPDYEDSRVCGFVHRSLDL